MKSESEPSRLMGVQQLRFWAALLVLCHHTLEECSANMDLAALKSWVLFGASGVDIFFVISGFVIWRATGGLGQKLSPADFMKRRLMRVVPLYWTCLSAALLLWSTGIFFRSISVSPTTLASSYFLLPPLAEKGLVIGAAWTLVYELYFYILCMAALTIRKAQIRPLFLACMLATVPWMLTHLGAVEFGAYYGNPIVAEFVFGCVLAHCARYVVERGFKYVLGAVGLLGLIGATMFLDSQGTAGLADHVRWWGWGIPAALLVAASVGGMQVSGRRGGRYLNVLGDASYALYLSHGFVMAALAKLLKSGMFGSTWATVSLGAVAVAVSVLASCIVHFYVEVPITRLIKGTPGDRPPS